MDFADRLTIVRAEGERLASAAERAGLDAQVPTCPGWQVRDLVRHIGGIHRWAATIVAEARPRPFDPFPDLEKAWPADRDLLQWFRTGRADLVRVLETAAPDLECFAIFRDQPPREFWARRQAHETGMHRADAEAASGPISPFAPDQAVDGIEEMLFGFATRRGSQLSSETARTITFSALDAGGEWTVHIGPDAPRAERGGAADASCRVRGTASDLFLLMWNRVGVDQVEVEGDPGALEVWRDTVQVRWR